ncbi:MAG: methionine--tRNA ligase, partial [Candidatus Micrarchaeota archaeon]|nr:methionine--tRNA ligase [Candidatus Micrarchaeota archaeon]
LYICATDEHGTPIVASAEKEKKTPKEFVDYYHERDKKEFASLGFSMDIFHRTSSLENREFTQHLYLKLKENGYIYEKEVAQAYCAKCSRFLPDRFVVGTCPHCNAEGQYSDSCDACGKALAPGELIAPKCIVCGSPPTTRTTKHKFLALGKLSSQLREWLTTNKRLQKEVVNYVINWLNSGLADWDITRELDWGVPVPGEPGKVFYVWFDAPIGYISSTAALRDDWQSFWKGDAEIVHFIGKDIVYHHFLFWPAILYGSKDGFKLPDAIPVRGYLNLEKRKFSKSKGWFVSIADFLANFNPDYLRYYETAITPYGVEDADFAWKDFQQKINSELVATVGNFIHRTLILIQKNSDSKIPSPDKEKFDELDNSLLSSIPSSRAKIFELCGNFKFKEAQEEILSFVAGFNRYLSAKEPWKEKDQAKLANCLYICSRGLTSTGILLEPFLPFSSRKLFAMLSLDESLLAWKNIDSELLAPGTKLVEVKPLFEKISDEKIEEQERKLKR